MARPPRTLWSGGGGPPGTHPGRTARGSTSLGSLGYNRRRSRSKVVCSTAFFHLAAHSGATNGSLPGKPFGTSTGTPKAVMPHDPPKGMMGMLRLGWSCATSGGRKGTPCSDTWNPGPHNRHLPRLSFSPIGSRTCCKSRSLASTSGTGPTMCPSSRYQDSHSNVLDWHWSRPVSKPNAKPRGPQVSPWCTPMWLMQNKRPWQNNGLGPP